MTAALNASIIPHLDAFLQDVDRVAPSGYSGQIFVGRTLTARLTGRPDIAILMQANARQ